MGRYEFEVNEIADLLDTILRMCRIGIILAQMREKYLLPTIMESIFEKATELVEYCKED